MNLMKMSIIVMMIIIMVTTDEVHYLWFPSSSIPEKLRSYMTSSRLAFYFNSYCISFDVFV